VTEPGGAVTGRASGEGEAVSGSAAGRFRAEAGAVPHEEAVAGRLVAEPRGAQVVSRRPKTVTPATSQAT
jgi:hypothetical protein